MIHLTVIIKHIKCYIPGSVGQMLSLGNHTLSSLQMSKFSSSNRAARNLFGKTQARPQAPQLHPFQDANTFDFHPRLLKPVCLVGKGPDEGTALVWDHVGSQPCRRVWLRLPAQKWCGLHKTTFPSRLPHKHSSWHREGFWKWENEAFLCCIYGFCYHIFKVRTPDAWHIQLCEWQLRDRIFLKHSENICQHVVAMVKTHHLEYRFHRYLFGTY